MKELQLAEIFYSLQGEGNRVGTPSIFVRFAGCNVGCTFCDTDYSLKLKMTPQQLLEHIAIYKCSQIIWTGGEPALQLTEELVRFFKSHGYYSCIETSGSKKVPTNLDYVVVSPKVSEVDVKHNFGSRIVDELKYVIKEGDILPQPSIKAMHHFLSPEFDGGFINSTLNQRNLDWCIKLCLENPKWRMSTQTHKWWRVQ